ncbi:MAG: MFS transporter [Rhodospirillales bacterium]|nr:MFS transporter [Rhodospirillales bacterium]MDH3918136.1 MFS transporter [Rhodospirillales bacterium]MDH3970305.1 MFS transporter [Rhodospirillales bacterium]
MIAILLSVAPVVLAASILMLGNSLLGIVIQLKLNEAGIAPELIGATMSAFFGGFMLGSLYAKRLVGRVGHVRTFAALAGISAVAVLIYPLVFSPPVWALLRVVQGFCLAGLFTVMESWLNERSTNETRGQVLTFHMSSYYLALCFGQLMVNLWDLAGLEAFIMAGILVTFSLVPIALTSTPAPEIAEVRPMALRALYACSPLAVVGVFLGGMMIGAVHGLAAVFAQNTGLSVFHVSLFTGAVVFGPFLLLWPIGRLSDRVGRRIVLGGSVGLALLGCLAMIGLAHLGASLPALLLLALFLGGTLTSIYPSSTAHAFDQLPRAQYVAAAGGLLLFFSAGATLGPLLASAAMGAFGPTGLFGYEAAVAAVLLGFLGYRALQRPKVPLVQPESFVDVPPTSPAAPQLDPRHQ